MMDLHCHIDLYPDPTDIVRSCTARGVHVLSVTTTPGAWEGTDALAQGRIRTALGLHPQIAHERRAELALFNRLLPQVQYVGEVGLDGSPEFMPHWKDQVDVFRAILRACAQAGGRIMSIHSRRASSVVLDCLEAHQGAGTAILHWFSGNAGDLDRAIAMGCWFSVNPAMLARQRGRTLIARMPRHRVLPESDGPFVRFGGEAILPWQTDIMSEALSRMWGTERAETDEILLANFGGLAGADAF